MMPEDKVPARGRRDIACGWLTREVSRRYVSRKTPKAFGNPHTVNSTVKAATN